MPDMAKPAPLRDLEHHDAFLERHIGPNEAEIAHMLEAIGHESLDAMTDAIVPGGIRSRHALALPAPMSEVEALARIRAIADRNKVFRSFIGQGYHGTHVPKVILRNILENPAWYTAYTPYQAEISQGRMEALINFQTMCSDLTGMDIANASLLDEATAAAEAMTLARRSAKSKSDVFFVSSGVHPQTLEVVRTRAEPLGIEVVVGDDAQAMEADSFAVLLQYPDTLGRIDDHRALAEAVHARNGVVCVATDLLALTLVQAPGEWGADIVVGNSQRFGVPFGFGGPHAAFMACRDAFKRSMPGRLIGVSVDAEGKPAYRLTLQTREQHIRREKATSNICTAQVLLAVMASMYAVYHGPEGLVRIARRVHRLAAILAHALRGAGVQVGDGFFDTLHVTGIDAPMLHRRARDAGINLRAIGQDSVGISLDETATREDVIRLAGLFGADISHGSGADIDALDDEVADALPSALLRTSKFMAHPVFNTHHSEHEMLRYMRALADKDLALDRTMIPLGSCTMKLNATAEMIPVTWPEFADIHPLAPAEQAEGYRRLIDELEAMLVEITGYDAVSLQPNSGAQGEYAGLLAIRAYHAGTRRTAARHLPDPRVRARHQPGLRAAVRHEGRGDQVRQGRQRRRRRHPRARPKVLRAPGRDHDDLPLDPRRVRGGRRRDLRDRAQARRPGVHRWRQPQRACRLARPGKWGSDVSHLNLHKTFCIPHGGGGPGVGPCAAKAHLAPYLPKAFGDEGLPTSGTGQRARWCRRQRSASILPISWMYITLMGAEGLRRATQVALLNANYVVQAPRGALPTLYTGRNGLVAHECILDLRPLKDDQRHQRRGRRQAPDRLRLPRPDPELPGRRHADGRADRERVLHELDRFMRRHDPDPRGDPRHRGRPPRSRGQPAEERPAHRHHGRRQRVDPRLPARAGGVSAADSQTAEVLATGGPRRQRLRRQERVLQLHPINEFEGEIEAFSEPSVA
jgi:glycine dehydrogenase